MGRRKLNYRFHNANSAETTVDALLKILLEANTEKARNAIQEAVKALSDDDSKSGAGYPV